MHLRSVLGNTTERATRFCLICLLVAGTVAVGTVVAQDEGEAAQPEPVVLYGLMGLEGNTVANAATAAPAVTLDLTLTDSADIRQDGVWFGAQASMARTAGPARALTEALVSANELTVEAVVTPANLTQGNAARVVSLSSDTVTRNFTLGQQEDRYFVRLRTPEAGDNGVPDIESTPGVVKTYAQHVVATFANGVVRIYVDGALVGQGGRQGDFSNWDLDLPLLLGNEGTGDRPWAGGLHLVGIYDKALTTDQVAARFAALAAQL